MAFGKRSKPVVVEDVREKLIDVDASMHGNLTFKDPVKLQINGRFEGNLDTKGSLTIGEGAEVDATIVGDEIVILGKVQGKVTARKLLRIIPPARVAGEINTPSLTIQEGAFLNGSCQMLDKSNLSQTDNRSLFTVEEIAKYLEVDADSVVEWARNGRIPALRDGETWRFDRRKVDEWVASQK